MLANPNVLSSWARGVPDPATGATLPSAPTLIAVPAHADIIPSQSFHELPSSARKSSYIFLVDPGLDIVTGDQMLGATDIITGADWPNDYPDEPGFPGFGGTIWIVRFHHESAAGPGAYRALYLEKVQISGPASPF